MIKIFVDDCGCLKSNFIGFAGTQMKPSDSTSRIGSQLKDFNKNFNNNGIPF